MGWRVRACVRVFFVVLFCVCVRVFARCVSVSVAAHVFFFFFFFFFFGVCVWVCICAYESFGNEFRGRRVLRVCGAISKHRVG